ncbi:MAG: hypothetical protein AUG13_07645 [Chloroflexi bacterium 13_1_20CM_2_59_7]|jgi:hypothetical protein|nr:MAG: hypothetical protein AUG13_07645 [Chloroflexi bacterium 13_1_20CM_2_59_7]
MRRISAYLIFSLVFLGVQPSTKAQDILVPAGTLLKCTLDEPNFSSATAEVGDPVVCHLSSLREFGQNVFPRGSYLGGHLEADKEPGHFVGKGYLKLEFDRIGFPSSDIPVPSKVIAAKGYKVDRHGDIVGRGHKTRDIVEWLIPPLWPWKILMLPARGPRPTLKGESQITVRLMDDIQVPRLVAATQPYERPASYDRPPRPVYRRQHFDRPPTPEKQRSFEPAEADNMPASNGSDATYAAQNTTAQENKVEVPEVSLAQTEPSAPNSGTMRQPLRTRWIALKPGSVYEVANYRIHQGSVTYVLASGAKASVDITEVDWRKTSHLNAEPTVTSVGDRAALMGGPEPVSGRD